MRRPGTHHVRKVLAVVDRHLEQLDVEELVDRVQRSANGQICRASAPE